MVELKWENPKCRCQSREESLANLRDDKDNYIVCVRDQGTPRECAMEATKSGDDSYVCEILFRNGSEYAYPGRLDFAGLQELFGRFCNGDDFGFIRNEWKKLQNANGLNVLFVLTLIAVGAAIFYYLHTVH